MGGAFCMPKSAPDEALKGKINGARVSALALMVQQFPLLLC